MGLETIAAGAGAWLCDKYGKAITDKTIGAAKEQWTRFNWELSARAGVIVGNLRRVYGEYILYFSQ